MTLRAHIGANDAALLRAARYESFTACAGHCRFDVLRMDVSLHELLLVMSRVGTHDGGAVNRIGLNYVTGPDNPEIATSGTSENALFTRATLRSHPILGWSFGSAT